MARKNGDPDILAVIGRIEQVREQQGLSQSEFARRLKIPIQTYSNYVNSAAYTPGIPLLLAVWREFRVRPDWVLGVRPEDARSQAAAGA